MNKEIEMTGRYLVTVAEHTPSILCEKHARAFEQHFIAEAIAHTIYEMDEDDEHYHCHACDLIKAKEYVTQLQEAANKPKIILPGEF